MIHRIVYAALLAPLIATAFATTAQAQTTETLGKGEIFVTSKTVAGSEVPMFMVTGVVDAAPAKLYEIVTNCDRFAERMPRVKEAEFVSKSAASATCKVTINMPFPLANLTAVTKDKRQAGPTQWYRKWSLVEGDYHTNTGSFVLEPFEGDPQRTLVKYSIHADPKTAIPDFIREKAQRSSLPGLIERLRKEVTRD